MILNIIILVSNQLRWNKKTLYVSQVNNNAIAYHSADSH